MKELSPPSTKTPLTEPDETTLNHIWQRWFSDLYNYLKRNEDRVSTVIKQAAPATGAYDPLGAAAAVQENLDEAIETVNIELDNRVILYDPIPPEDTLLIKDSAADEKSYVRLDAGDGLQIDVVDGIKTISVPVAEYADLLEQLRQWTILYPLPSVGRRLMSPIGAPMTQGMIYPR